MKIRLLAFLCVTILAFTAMAKTPTVNKVRLGQNKNVTRVVMETNSSVKPKVFTLPSPPRVVIDFPNVKFKQDLHNITLPVGSIVTGMRQGQFNPKTVRMVLDVKQPVDANMFFIPKTGKYGHRIVVDFKANDKKVKSVPKEVAAFEATTKTKKISVTKATKAEIKKPTVPVKKGAKKSTDPIIVMIDPGHGGVDPGAIGKYKTQEKHIVLSVAKKLQAELNKQKNVKAYLTRSSDTYVKLRDRVRRAQTKNADLFISLHADAHKKRSVKGGSVYVLSERSSDKEAARLARVANMGDIVAGVSMKNETKEVRNILIDLAQRETMNSSALLGKEILNEMKNELKLRKKKVMFAGFAVLKAPEIPSVLIELSYLSNPGEEKMLKSKTSQNKIARSLSKGIVKYIKKHMHTK